MARKQPQPNSTDQTADAPEQDAPAAEPAAYTPRRYDLGNGIECVDH